MAKSMKGVTCITRKGSAYWYARVDGRRVYCGEGAKGRELAVAARSKAVAKRYENREVVAGLLTKRSEFRTVRELANWYMTELPAVQGQRAYGRKIAHGRHLLGALGSKGVGQVETGDLEQYRERRAREGAMNGTIDNELSLLRAMYSEARKRKKVLPEMVPGQFPILAENNPRPVITEEQYQALLAVAPSDDFRDVMICAWESAMRSSEIAGLTAGQVHLGVRHLSGMVVDYIDLGVFDTKTKTRRTVPVSPELKAVLERRMQGLGPEDRVFTEGGKEYYPSVVSYRMESACNRAGIPHGDKTLNAKGEKVGVVFHCFRHTRTTRWVEMGFSDEIIRRATGHNSLEAYRTYVKLDPSAVMRLVGHTNSIKPSRMQAAVGS